MDKKLTADLNVLSNSGLEIELLNGDLNIIQKLDDEPNDVGGLTSAQLKAKFDESGNIIKEYINKILVPAVLAEDATEESRKAAEAQRKADETARQAAEQARAAAEQGRASAESERETAETQRKTAEAARQAAEQARADENTGIVARATAQANAAAGSAASAAGSASTAMDDARIASDQAATAVGAASNASASEAAAAQSSASASNASMAAQSWAVGGTGTRTGEDTNNAKYWAGQAQAVVGGDFATKAEAQGYVDTHNQSTEAHSDIRTALATHAAQHATGGSDPLTPGDIDAANKETQEKVFITYAPSRTVTVAAAELPAYINALPRLLTENITINVGAGTCTDKVDIFDFYGCGSIRINGAASYGSVFSGGITIRHCLIHVDIRGVSVSANSGTVVGVTTAAYVYLESCKIDGSNATYCASSYEGAHLSLTSCTLSNCSSGSAILCGHTSIAALSDCSANANQTGAFVYRGGIVLLAGSTPDTLGGSSNKKSGGMIVKANGTLL